MRGRFGHILEELREHLPYTVLAALIGVGFMALINFEAALTNRQAVLPEASRDLFHTFHFSHLFFSAIATTAMFWRHDRMLGKTLLVGFFGTVLPCGTSDVVFPFVGGRMLGVPMEFHLCLVEHPFLVLPFVLGGIGVGFLLPPVQRSTIFSHAAHVILSSSATMLYLISFGVADWLRFAALVFLLLIAAVMIPCCTSDIVFPLLFTRQRPGESHAVHRAV
ncbi:MAG: hypothetical protein HYZ95_02870 [Candidatus Omnitrophica bacterium]|nr:hypothetical protein [Candidatus Omnitrophota bacterium]